MITKLKTPKINIKTSLFKLRRQNYKYIWYNKDCNIKLRPNEIESVNNILLFLYNDYLKHKDIWINHLGLKMEHLKDCFVGTHEVNKKRRLRTNIWLLIPQFIDIKGRGYRMDARYCKLNQNGIALVELLLLDKEAGHYVKLDELNNNTGSMAEVENIDGEVEEEEDE